MAILESAAAAASIGNTVLGFFGADKKRKRNRNAILRAYERSARRLEQDQRDVRQGTTESLVARGLLTSGEVRPEQAPATPKTMQEIAAGAPKKVGAMGMAGALFGAVGQEARRLEDDRFRRESMKGEAGRRNTIAGGVQSDLSKEFTQERIDLRDAKNDALNANKADYLNDAIAAVASGVRTGLNVYEAGQAFAGMRELTSPAAKVSIQDAYGIDPIDPLGFTSTWHGGQPNFSFNVQTQGGG